MKKVLEWARALIISPESVAVGCVALVSYYRPDLTQRVGAIGQFDKLDGWVLALAAAPLPLVGLTYSAAMKVLRPEIGRADLISWPDYWRLRIQVLSALTWVCVGVLAWLGGGLLIKQGAVVVGTAIAVSGIAAAAIATVTTSLARLDVQDALEGAPTGDT
ncbi:MAG: hypothetical protein IPF87_10550 [Gemmatimonadetes bacterium]|nr:hypothetical protein [Gemmatimonadota bacterium]